jgi:hypothetical protein
MAEIILYTYIPDESLSFSKNILIAVKIVAVVERGIDDFGPAINCPNTLGSMTSLIFFC